MLDSPSPSYFFPRYMSGLSQRHVWFLFLFFSLPKVLELSRFGKRIWSTSCIFCMIPDKELWLGCNRQRQIALMMFYFCGSKNNPEDMVFICSVSSVELRCPALSNPSLYRGQKVTLFLPERLCCHANTSSSGVWECVRFYDLMTPVGSDQRVGLSVASCEFTSAYSRPGCDSSAGLVVGMEPHFWIFRGDQMVGKWRALGGVEGGCEERNPQGTIGSMPRESSYTQTLWHTGRR